MGASKKLIAMNQDSSLYKSHRSEDKKTSTDDEEELEASRHGNGVTNRTRTNKFPTDEELDMYAEAFDKRYIGRLNRIMLTNRALHSQKAFESRKIDLFRSVTQRKQQLKWQDREKSSTRASVLERLASEHATVKKQHDDKESTVERAATNTFKVLFPSSYDVEGTELSETTSDESEDSEEEEAEVPKYHSIVGVKKAVKVITNWKGSSETSWLQPVMIPYVPPTPPMQAFVRVRCNVRGGEQPILRYCPYFGDNEDVRPLAEVYILNLRPNLVAEREKQLSLCKLTYIACACLSKHGLNRYIVNYLCQKLGCYALRSLIEFNSQELVESAKHEHHNFIRVDKNSEAKDRTVRCPEESTFWTLEWADLKRLSSKNTWGIEINAKLPIHTSALLNEAPSMRIDFPSPYKVALSGARYKRSKALFDANSREHNDLLRYAKMWAYPNDSFESTVYLSDDDWCQADGRIMSVFKSQICRQTYLYADCLHGPFPVDDLTDQFNLFRYTQLPKAKKWNDFVRRTSDPRYIREVCAVLGDSIHHILTNKEFKIGDGCGNQCFIHKCGYGDTEKDAVVNTVKSGKRPPSTNLEGEPPTKVQRSDSIQFWTEGLAALVRRLHILFHGCCCAISQTVHIPCCQVYGQLSRMGLRAYPVNAKRIVGDEPSADNESADSSSTELESVEELSRHLEQDIPSETDPQVKAIVELGIAQVLLDESEGSTRMINAKDKGGIKALRRQIIDHIMMTIDVLSSVDGTVQPGGETVKRDDKILPIIKSTSQQLGNPQDMVKMRTRQASVAKKHVNQRVEKRVYPAEVVCHHAGACSIENDCPCARNQQFCSKFCSCSVECFNKWHGCACSSKCRTKGCPCVASDKECDPDMCHSCGAHTAVEIAFGASHIENLPYSNIVRKADPFSFEPNFEQNVSNDGKDEDQEEGISGENSNFMKKERNSTTWSTGVGLLAELTNWRSIDKDAERNEAKCKMLSRHCTNASLRTGRKVRLLVGESNIPNAGFGLFAGQNIEKGDLIEEYQGEIVSQIEAERRGSIYDFLNRSYIFDLNDDVCLDATRKGNKMRFANHSKTPNCYARKLTVSGRSAIGIFAAKHINAHEELFFDYNYEKSVEHANRQRGAAVHVGWLKDGSLAGKVNRAGLKKQCKESE